MEYLRTTLAERLKAFSLIQLFQLAMGLFCLGDYLFYSGQLAVLLLGSVLMAQAIFDKQLGCVSEACTREAPWDRKTP